MGPQSTAIVKLLKYLCILTIKLICMQGSDCPSNADISAISFSPISPLFLLGNCGKLVCIVIP